MTTKICKDCGIEKPIGDFHKVKKMRDGHLNNCRACCYLRRKKQRGTKEFQERNRKYQSAYQKRNREKRKILRERYPERIEARRAVYRAIKSGELKKGLCEECGVEKVEAHHKDYLKPLEVNWLCRKHHAIRDAGSRIRPLPLEPILE